MNKRKILALAIIAFLGALIVGGTSAYFTATSRTHNIITTSGVAIELIEDTDELGADGRPIPFTDIEGVMPGDKISKIPKIKNIDNSDVFVRIKLTASAKLSSGESRDISPDFFEFDLNRSWTKVDGYYYYLRILSSGETTMPLFTSVTIPEKVSSEYQYVSFTLSIQGEAVQVANNGTSVLEAQGWPED